MRFQPLHNPYLVPGKEAAAASGTTFVGVVEAGAGCDDAKVLTPAMDAATKQCSDKDPGDVQHVDKPSKSDINCPVKKQVKTPTNMNNEQP